MRKLSDGILPCGRCGGKTNIQTFFDIGIYAECKNCELRTNLQNTVADTIVVWNNLSAATHPEPEDYLELLEECCPPVPEFSSADSRCGNHLNIMLDLLTDYGDDDD